MTGPDLAEAEEWLRAIVTAHHEYLRDCVEGGAEEIAARGGVAGTWGLVLREYDRRGAELSEARRVIADLKTIAKAAEAYRDETSNDLAPDYTQRRILRAQLFDALADEVNR